MIERNVHEYLGNTYFSMCQGQDILELGPLNGEFSTEILKHGPKSLTLLEASRQAISKLQYKFTDSDVVKIIHGDMHNDLEQVGKVDVAIVLGVIYHSHAPLHLLEEIVNQCNPNVILLDAPGANPGWGVACQDELPNMHGMRYIINSRKTCNIVMQLYQETIVLAMRNLGYGVAVADTYPCDVNIKSNVPIYKFEKLS